MNSSSREHVDSDSTRDNTLLIQWIRGCAEADEKALESLYRATSAQVFGLLQRMLKTPMLAEEALQECYLKVWNRASDYQPGKSTPRTWIISIARNHAIDVLRKRRIREDLESEFNEFDADPLDSLNFRIDEDSEPLQICLENLAAPARQCVVMAYCEGYSQEELSERMQRPVGTIKSWLRRSLISLRKCLNGFT